MNRPETHSNASRLACRLVQAAERASPAALENQIRRVQSEFERLPKLRRATGAGEQERMELLGAIVEALRVPATRRTRQIHLRLLRHLARPARRRSEIDEIFNT
ncbi:MAG: hypothetical protein HY822_00965 [Acidobacteria bacterium]|nr:hypothetical protein [Acidobacteriota bacterium]